MYLSTVRSNSEILFSLTTFQCHLSSLYDFKTFGEGGAYDVIFRMYYCIMSTMVGTFLPLTSLDWAWIIIFKFWNVLNWVAKTGGAGVEGGG